MYKIDKCIATQHKLKECITLSPILWRYFWISDGNKPHTVFKCNLFDDKPKLFTLAAVSDTILSLRLIAKHSVFPDLNIFSPVYELDLRIKTLLTLFFINLRTDNRLQSFLHCHPRLEIKFAGLWVKIKRKLFNFRQYKKRKQTKKACTLHSSRTRCKFCVKQLLYNNNELNLNK